MSNHNWIPDAAIRTIIGWSLKLLFIAGILAALFCAGLAIYGATQNISLGEAWQVLWTAIQNASKSKSAVSQAVTYAQICFAVPGIA